MIISRQKDGKMLREVNLLCCVCHNTVITSAPETENDDELIVQAVNSYAAHVQMCIGKIIAKTDSEMKAVMDRLHAKPQIGGDGMYHLPKPEPEPETEDEVEEGGKTILDEHPYCDYDDETGAYIPPLDTTDEDDAER